MLDNVNIIIFPIEFARQVFPEQWKDRKSFDSPKGHVIDHVGFSVETLADSLDKLRKEGVISAGAFGGFSALAPSDWMEIYGVNLGTVLGKTWSADFDLVFKRHQAN